MSAETFFVDDLIDQSRGLAQHAQLKHPFLRIPIAGGAAIRDLLRTTFAALGHEVVEDVRFAVPGTSAVVWHSSCDRRPIRGLTVALTGPTGEVEEVRLMLCQYAMVVPWRTRLREQLPSLPGWELAPDEAKAIVAKVTDPSWQADTAPLFDPTEQIKFYAPAFTKPIEGPEAVALIIRNARAVYGVCELGTMMRAPEYALRPKTSKLPLEIATMLHFTPDGRVDETWVFMQPWPVVSVFRDCVRARLGDGLDSSFFELEAR
jgi:hypothetical protein